MAQAGFHRDDFFNKLAGAISGLPSDLYAKREEYKFEPWTFISEQCETITDIDPPKGVYRSKRLQLFPAQIELLKDIVVFDDSGMDFYFDDVHIEKSRQQGMSWILADLGLWAIEFWPNVAGMYLSRKEEEVDDGGARSTRDSIFGKIRYAYEHQDEWLQQYAPLDFKFLQISNPAQNSFIVGESANPNAGRGGTYKFCINDEWAFVPNSEAVAMAVDQACKRGKILNSTPHGTGNHYARIKRMHNRGLDTGYKFVRLHWTQNPLWARGLYLDERTGQFRSPMYDSVTKTMTKEAIARELEMSYTSSMSGLVYPEFNLDLDAPGTNEFDAMVDFAPKKGPVYCGWDFGLNDPTCFLLFQKNELGGYDIFYEMQEDGQPIENFVPWINDLKRAYPADWYHFGDIAGIQREKVTGSSVIEELARHGIQVQYKKQAVQDGISLIRVMHQNRQIRVHSRCLVYIECKTNYHYPLGPDGQPREGIEIPYHDWSSHLMDAERYAAMGVFEGAEIDPEDFYQSPAEDWLESDVDVETLFGSII